MTQTAQLSAGALTRRAGDTRALWLFSWPLLAGIYVYVYFFFHGQDLLLDGDTYSHIATGRWILEQGVVPSQDPFSHTMRGAPWTAFEWLSQVILAVVHQFGGWTGLVAVIALAFAATIGLLTRALLRWLEPIYALLFAGLGVAMTAGHVLARPHMLAMPLMMIWTIELVRASEANRAPTLWMLPLMTVWANLHGGFTLGIALTFAFALEAILSAPAQQRLASGRSWGVFLLLTVLCALLTPHGFRGLAVTWQVLFQDNYALARIGEWRSPDFHVLQPLEFWLLGAVALAMYQGLRLPPIRLLLLVGLMHLTLKHIRNAELLGLLAPLFLAAPLAAQWRLRGRDKAQLASADRFFGKLARPAGHGAVVATLAGFLAIAVWIGQHRPIEIPETIAPRAAIKAAQDAGVSAGRVLNAYEWGGYLIYLGMPSFIDGRSDMYRDTFIKEYVSALDLQSPDGLEKLLAKHKVTWTLLPPQLPAVALLDRLPGWRRVYSDKTAVVHAIRHDVGIGTSTQGALP